jgi:hypothetical protein
MERKRRDGFFADLGKHAREEATAAWAETGGDKQKAIARAKERLNARFGNKPGFSPIVMSLLIQIAIQLLLEWWNNKQLARSTVTRELGQPTPFALACYDGDYQHDDCDHCFDAGFFDHDTGAVC